MRLAALLALVFVGLFSMWAFTGAQIMRCALGIELADNVALEGVAPPGEWLVRLAEVGRENAARHEHREVDSF
jgi:hypothetical protein